jgi:hypothetical protein
MAGRLGHIDGKRRVGHVPINGIRKTNYAYGFGGLLNWFDAGRGTSATTNLGLISFWNDLVNHNVSFVMLTAASQPRLILSDANYNGYPSVEFHTNARRLISTIGFTFEKTLVVVFKCNTETTQNAIFGDGTGVATAGNRRFVARGSATSITGIGMYTNSGDASAYKTSIEDFLPHIVVLTEDHIIVDGVSVAVTGKLNTIGSWNYFGASGTQTTAHFIGSVAEVLNYSEKLTEEQCIRLSDTINSKYAIY